MKMFKRLKCVFIAVCLFLCFCIPVGAETIDLDDGDSSVSVTAKYTAGIVTDVYSVDIEWGSMAFEYVDAGTRWDPEKHEYTTTLQPEWKYEEGANTVTVTNHSNNPVEVALSYTPASGYSEITGTFDTTAKTLAAATENSALEDAPSFTAKLTLSGKLSSSATSSTVIGIATVTLSTTDSSGGTTESSNSSESEPEEDATVITTEPVGYVYLYSRLTSPDYDKYKYNASIYQQSSNTYFAEICTETVMSADFRPDTQIYINDTLYYIYEKGDGYQFTSGTTVDINKNYYDYNEDAENPYRKETVIEAGKTYKLTITLDEDAGTGTATLEEVTA